MTPLDDPITHQRNALLQLVAELRDQQCRQLREQAEAEAQAILDAAHREAASRTKQALKQERAKMKRAVQTARARKDTARRSRDLAAVNQLLATGRQILRQQLLERWHHPNHRHQWIQALGQEAARSLPPGIPTIAHPEAWSTAEWSAANPAPDRPALDQPALDQPALDQPAPNQEVRFLPDPNLAAGLRLSLGDTCLDGSLDGLLEDHSARDAMLLAFLHQEADRPHSPPGERPPGERPPGECQETEDHP